MKHLIGIRREDKNIWEKRVPLIPEHVKKLKEEFEIETVIQPFPTRAFTDDEYRAAGAEVKEDISAAPVIFGVKEIPVKLLLEHKTYLMFSHTIKGQSYNMPLLRRLMELKCNLIDYETIADEKKRRLVFFGKFAGLAGMIDGLNGLGKRLKYLGYETPLLQIKQAYQYAGLEEAKEEIKAAGEKIKKEGLPEELTPLVVGVSGYGHVSQGAQEIFDLLPHKEIAPNDLKNLSSGAEPVFYKTVFKEVDMFEPKDESTAFDLHDYFNHPEKYKSKFEQYLERLTMLVNAIYWYDACPRLITKDYLKKNFEKVKLQLVADISIDIDGSIEFSYKATEPDNPAFVYNPLTGEFTDGYEGEGIVDITIDNLPTELPKNASVSFSEALMPFVPAIAKADYSKSFDELQLPAEIKRAMILHKGELTESYKYLGKFLNE